MTDIDLRLGAWQDVLADVECDALICDPPYGERTHARNNAGVKQARTMTGQKTRQSIDYASLTPDGVHALVSSWSPRVRGWIACLTSHDLIPHWIDAYEAAGRYAFAPVIITQKRLRLVGDGPSSRAVYMMVSRPKTRRFATWGCLPGGDEAPTVSVSGISGAKPVSLIRQIVGDYSDPRDVVCDPFAGSGSTLIAAADLGCQALGDVMDAATYEATKARVAAHRVHLSMFATHPRATMNKRAMRKAQGVMHV